VKKPGHFTFKIIKYVKTHKITIQHSLYSNKYHKVKSIQERTSPYQHRQSPLKNTQIGDFSQQYNH